MKQKWKKKNKQLLCRESLQTVPQTFAVESRWHLWEHEYQWDMGEVPAASAMPGAQNALPSFYR